MKPISRMILLIFVLALLPLVEVRSQAEIHSLSHRQYDMIMVELEKLVDDQISFTRKEEKIFQPIFEQMLHEFHPLIDQQVKLMNALTKHAISEDAYHSLHQRWLLLEGKTLDLKKKYSVLMHASLPAAKVTSFFLLMEQTGAVVQQQWFQKYMTQYRAL